MRATSLVTRNHLPKQGTTPSRICAERPFAGTFNAMPFEYDTMIKLERFRAPADDTTLPCDCSATLCFLRNLPVAQRLGFS